MKPQGTTGTPANKTAIVIADEASDVLTYNHLHKAVLRLRLCGYEGGVDFKKMNKKELIEAAEMLRQMYNDEEKEVRILKQRRQKMTKKNNTFTGSWIVLILLLFVFFPAAIIYFIMKWE